MLDADDFYYAMVQELDSQRFTTDEIADAVKNSQLRLNYPFIFQYNEFCLAHSQKILDIQRKYKLRSAHMAVLLCFDMFLIPFRN